MLIYIFVEHYPNPYKPYFDTQFSQLIRSGHVIRIFASGKYTSTLNNEIKLYKLDEKIQYYPTTLKTLPRFALSLVIACIRHPFVSIKHSVGIFDRALSFKQNLMMIARMLMLPDEEPDLCLVHNLAIAVNFTFLMRRYPMSRVIMYFHGGEIPRTPRIKDGKLGFEKVHFVFTNTEFSRQQAIQRGCDAQKIGISPVGFYIPDYPADCYKEYRRDGILRLLSIGRLGEEKGFIYVLEAIKGLIERGVSKLEYRIIGYGYLLPVLQDFVNKNGLFKHVIFAGEKSKADVINELRLADALILPSTVTETWAETQACVVQESMLMRLIILTTKAGGVPESIPKGMRRFSVECHDAKGIADKILDILSLTDAEMHEIGNAGREFAINNYDIKLVTDSILHKIQQTAKQST